MPRVDNIHRIADLVSGVVVKPGEQFSVNEHVGPRTTDKGFKAAPTIVYGEMEDTVGGGISQFATTLFNAAFHGGYDIVERTPHSYYFPRYPMGHEATLSFPKPDLIVRNDTRAGLWIHCSYTPTSITVKLFGDNAGRRVRRKVSKVRDVTRPPLEYLADAALDPDEEKVRERGQVGWTVVVSRIIEFADGTSRTEERKVVYQPRVRRVRVHPCKIPEGEKGYTGERCPEQEEAEAQADAHGDGEAATGAPSDVEGHAIDSAEDEG
jgi:vancomycin resistance protein YoaR